MSIVKFAVKSVVICRIGSLEILHAAINCQRKVICRIGSLEIPCASVVASLRVICRIGSLEICQTF